MPHPVCPICRVTETTLFFPKGEHKLYICRNCRHVFWETMPDISTLAAYYESHYTASHEQSTVQQEHRAYYRGHAAELAAIAGRPLQDLAIADIGCSYPVFLEEAVAAGGHLAVGVDFAQEARVYGLAHGILVITPDALLTQIPDESLDLLRYSHTLEHLIDPVGTLRQQVRKLRPGGIVYITQPNFPVFRFQRATGDIHDSVWPTHLHFFSPISILYLTQAAGLSVERLFSVTDPEIGQERYGPSIDLDYARDRLQPVAAKGEELRGALNNYPHYTGLNSTILLRRGTMPVPDASEDLQLRLEEAQLSLRMARTILHLRTEAAGEHLAGATESAPSPATAPTAAPVSDLLQPVLQRIEDVAFDALALAVRPRPSIDPLRIDPPRLTLRTDNPLALSSADHLHPRGTANDDTRHPRFVAACERRFTAPIRHLDLGCVGGGLVWDFLLAGHHSYGIEGSDFFLVNRRGYWRVLPEQYFTADVTQPFALLDAAGRRQAFDVITAWEVLEHLPEATLPGFCENVVQSLRPGGLFIASVATFPDQDEVTGAVWHVTINPKDWWLEIFARHALHPVEADFVVADFVRGSGNPRARDWDVRTRPEMGFHVVLMRSA